MDAVITFGPGQLLEDPGGLAGADVDSPAHVVAV